MSNTNHLLKVWQLSRFYDGGEVQALRNVRFEAEPGETVALIGPSGCGKTTLLSLLGLLDQPSSGQILFDGQDYAQIRRRSAFRALQIGFVFQFHHMVATMTLQENVEAPLVALGVNRSERKRRSLAMLEKMDIATRAHFLPGRVSGGERQRAAVARALISQPAMVLADEPTGNLDSQNGQRVVDLLIRHAHDQRALVLLATHNPDIACAADRCITLLDGAIVGESESRNALTMQKT